MKRTTHARTLGIAGAIFALGLIAVPFAASAISYINAPQIWPTGFWGPLVSCTGNYLQDQPACRNLCDLVQTFVNVIYFVMSVALFIIAPVLVLVGAIMIMVAGANPGMLENGKKTLKSTVIGIVIILCSYVIVSTFLYALNITGIGGFGGAECSPPSSMAPARANPLLTALIPTAFAQTQIQIASSVPNTNPVTTATGAPGAIIAGFYQFALLAAGILAFGAVVYGGVKYLISAGNPSSQSEGRQWIESALIGLALLAGAYVILEIINPALLNLTLPTLQAINIAATSPVGAGGAGAAVGIASTCAGGSCGVLPNCTNNSRVNCGGAPSMVNTLNCIAQKDPNFRVSEGWPPTATGRVSQGCHANGCCVDTVAFGGGCAEAEALAEAAQACGAAVVNEYQGCNVLGKVGQIYPGTTGNNLHIESSQWNPSTGGC